MDGESIAIHQITKSLVTQGHQVDVLAMLTSKHPNADESSELKTVQYTYVQVETSISVLGAFKSMFTKDPYIVERFQSNEFIVALAGQLNAQSYDVIICEGVFLGSYLDVIRKYSLAKVILRTHNIEHIIWKRLAKESKYGLKRFYLKRIMVPQFRQFEEQFIQKVDGVLPISPVDEEYVRKLSVKPILCIPVALDEFRSAPLPEKFSIGFLGGLDWQPNVDGLVWFLDKVWKPFVKKNKDVQLQIAGRNMPKAMFDWKYPNTSFLGEVPNAKSFLDEQSVLIVPVFSGSGMRVKIIEAMSQGKCVLSSPIGAEGIRCKHGQHILIGETPKEWRKALEDLMCSPDKISRLGDEALRLVKEEYSANTFAEKLHVFLRQL